MPTCPPRAVVGAPATALRPPSRRPRAASSTAQNNLDAAKQQQDVTEASGRLARRQRPAGVVSAQNALDQASSDRPSNISAQAGQVTAARPPWTTGPARVDDTTLRAPVDGTRLGRERHGGRVRRREHGHLGARARHRRHPARHERAGSGAAAAQAVGATRRGRGARSSSSLDNVDDSRW
jgi:hypothetical protein